MKRIATKASVGAAALLLWELFSGAANAEAQPARLRVPAMDMVQAIERQQRIRTDQPVIGTATPRPGPRPGMGPRGFPPGRRGFAVGGGIQGSSWSLSFFYSRGMPYYVPIYAAPGAVPIPLWSLCGPLFQPLPYGARVYAQLDNISRWGDLPIGAPYGRPLGRFDRSRYEGALPNVLSDTSLDERLFEEYVKTRDELENERIDRAKRETEDRLRREYEGQGAREGELTREELEAKMKALEELDRRIKEEEAKRLPERGPLQIPPAVPPELREPAPPVPEYLPTPLPRRPETPAQPEQPAQLSVPPEPVITGRALPEAALEYRVEYIKVCSRNQYDNIVTGYTNYVLNLARARTNGRIDKVARDGGYGRLEIRDEKDNSLLSIKYDDLIKRSASAPEVVDFLNIRLKERGIDPASFDAHVSFSTYQCHQ